MVGSLGPGHLEEVLAGETLGRGCHGPAVSEPPPGPGSFSSRPLGLWEQCYLRAPDGIVPALCRGLGGWVVVWRGGSCPWGGLCMRPCPPCTRTEAAVVPSAGDRGRRSKRELLSWGYVAPPASPGSRGILPHFPLQGARTPQSLLNTWLMKPNSGPPQEWAPSFSRWSSDPQHRRTQLVGNASPQAPTQALRAGLAPVLREAPAWPWPW